MKSQETVEPNPPDRASDSCAVVIFGASGDLTRRKLMPALYNLACGHLLPRHFAVVGVARTQLSNDDFRKKVHDDVKAYCGECVEDELWTWFMSRFYYFTGDFGDEAFNHSLRSLLIDAFNAGTGVMFVL